MNSVAGSQVPSGDVKPPAAITDVSLVRLYALRAAYLVMAVGLGVYIWPAVIHHTNEFGATQGVRYALLAGLGGTASIGASGGSGLSAGLISRNLWPTGSLTVRNSTATIVPLRKRRNW
jgi:hypothetical protein